MKPNVEQLLNLTDLSFFDFCNQMYQINRGVYNTIDAWFYKNGLPEIIPRRKTILSFLEFIKSQSPNQAKYVKFGHGGLSGKLQEFLALDISA